MQGLLELIFLRAGIAAFWLFSLHLQQTLVSRGFPKFAEKRIHRIA